MTDYYIPHLFQLVLRDLRQITTTDTLLTIMMIIAVLLLTNLQWHH